MNARSSDYKTDNLTYTVRKEAFQMQWSTLKFGQYFIEFSLQSNTAGSRIFQTFEKLSEMQTKKNIYFASRLNWLILRTTISQHCAFKSCQMRHILCLTDWPVVVQLAINYCIISILYRPTKHAHILLKLTFGFGIVRPHTYNICI